MVDTKNIINKNAYFELYEIIRNLSSTEIEKIPKIFVNNLKLQMEENDFVYDKTKNISNQNIRIETKALLIEMYYNYLATEEEKNILKKYKQICFDSVEKKKKNLYNKIGKKDIFKDNHEITVCIQPKQEMALIKNEDISIFDKIKQKIAKLFHMIF